MRVPLLLAGVSVALASPAVKVALRTSWPAPPLLIEIIETIGLLHPDAFFHALDTLTDPGRWAESRPSTDEAVYQWALATAKESSIIPETAFVEAQLALHAAVPKIEAFYQQRGVVTGLPGSEDCQSWVEWYGDIICDLEKLVHRVGHAAIDADAKNSTEATSIPAHPKTLSFDHIYPPFGEAVRPSYAAVLYGNLESPNFRALHSYLLSIASSPERRVSYIFRPAPPATRDDTDRSYLSGYGVALDLKKMEYLAVDDRHSASSATQDTNEHKEETTVSSDPIVTLLDTYPVNETLDASTPLTQEELSYIGYQVAQLVASAANPSEALRVLSQNFPRYATTIARRVVVEDEVEEGVAMNSKIAQPGSTAVWLNGGMLQESDMNPFNLMHLILKERAIVEYFEGLGLSAGQAVELLTHSALSKSQSIGVLDGLYDASDRQEGSVAISWLNNLEKDARYENWFTGTQTLLRPLYPGQFHNVKYNMWNVVYIIDLSHSSSLETIGSALNNIIARGFPFRFGIVPSCATEEGTNMAKLFWHMLDTYGADKTIAFIKTVAGHPAAVESPVPWNIVGQGYAHFVKSMVPPPEDSEGDDYEPRTLDQIVADAETYEPRIAASNAYMDRLSVTIRDGEEGHAFVNGRYFKKDDDFFRGMQQELGQQLQHLQEQIYMDQYGDEEAVTIDTYFYDQPTTNLRRNPYIIPSDKQNPLNVISLSDLLEGGEPFNGFVYSGQSEHVPITVHAIADFDSEDGQTLLKEALKMKDEDSVTRLSFLHVPSQERQDQKPFVSTLLSHIASTSSKRTATARHLLAALGLNDEDNSRAEKDVLDHRSALQAILDGTVLEKVDSRQYDEYVRFSTAVLRRVGLSPGAMALIVNGRIINSFPLSAFRARDIEELVHFELKKRVGPVIQALTEVRAQESESFAPGNFSDVIALLSSLLSAIQIPDPTQTGLFNKPPQARQRPYQLLSRDHVGFTVGDNSTALVHLGFVLDPLSESAQKWSSIIEWAAALPRVYVEVVIHPALYTEVPLKRFYRYNLLSRLHFTESGEEAKALVAFDDLPTAPIYTMVVDAPISWVVRPREALHDLDNLQLSHLHHDENIEAVYDLDYIVVEGHARESHNNAAPRGLQLQLTAQDGSTMDDTQVVATLGYLQFKAKPGVFRLEIREGQGRDIYRTDSVGTEGWNSPNVTATGNEIAVTSFEGSTLYPRFGRRPGAEHRDVLVQEEPETEEQKPAQGVIENVMSKVTSLFKSAPEKDVPTTDVAVAQNVTQQADINIFTVASGLLYERFSSIMILSVLRNTNSTVKFWFIENFLSPSFLEFIPHFAEEYNFQYELVTYKWPSWLRAQKEKQRIIWAYKILFLDVLFPMDLKKVIFVDADQIVRADMKELVDLDLHGAPYGYTPMGDDNTDMEGFRFWKTGYWKDYLRGLPYHISALYIVDLLRFRQLAAGDILRSSYQQLSADPNSLANLDQDLPNNLQRDVPIYSLNEDWLWCETWCSKDRLHRAKTIDLCQNPLTKEPKLARARAIPEWEEYDSEVARFTRSLADRGLIRSASSADINALAGEAKASPKAEPNETREAEHTRDEL